MILLRVSNGAQAGHERQGRRFPFRIGRSASADLRLNEPGVWEDHAEIRFSPEGYYIKSRTESPVLIDGAPGIDQRLRNGQELQFGGVRVQFWLANPGQGGLGMWQSVAWGVIALCAAAQLWVVYRLIG